MFGAFGADGLLQGADDEADLAATGIGGKAHEFAMDLSDPLAVGSVTREIAVTIGAPEVLVNVAGSLLLGAVAADSPAWVFTLLGAGVAGALTTYSAFALETLELAPRRAAGNVLATLAVGSAAFALGWWLGG